MKPDKRYLQGKVGNHGAMRELVGDIYETFVTR
jgi:hypothetical protein